MKFKKINYTDVTVDPITNFYKKVKDEIPEIINHTFVNYYENNKKYSDSFYDAINEIKNNNIMLIKKKQELKIISRKWQNFAIISSCLVVVGFFFLKKLKENDKVIKEFKKYKNNINKNNNKLEEKKKIEYTEFFNNFDLTKTLEQVANNIGLQYRNYLLEREYKSIVNYLNPLWIDNAHVFLYKTSPIIDVSYKLLNFEDVITSRSRTYTYTTFEYEDGSLTPITNYEVLTAYHNEPTPFIKNYEDILYLTHFNKDLNFNLGNRKYLNFENKDFTKKYRVNNKEKMLDNGIIEFFTIKAQDEYVKLFEIANGDILNNFSKTKEIIEITNGYFKMNTNINVSLNIIEFEEKNYEISKMVELLKNQLNNYFKNLIFSMTHALISPMISREVYSNRDENYRISNNINENEILDESLDFNNINFYSIVNRIFCPKLITFNNSKPKRPKWLNIIKVNKTKQYYTIDCVLHSYKSEKLVDNVTVSGESGVHVIPVPYEHFTPIKEDKQIFFIPMPSNQIPNFKISNLLTDFITKNNPNFENNWLYNIPFWTHNTKYFQETTNNDLIQIIKAINQNLSNDISVVKIDEGVAIINNNVKKDNAEIIDMIKSIIYRLANL